MGAVGLGQVLQRQALVQRVVRLDVVAQVETVCKGDFDVMTMFRDLSEIKSKLLEWSAWQARAGCYSQAALSSNDSKTLYALLDLRWPPIVGRE